VRNREEGIELGAIPAELRGCVEDELAALPGSRVIRRKGRLWFKGRNGFEILLERLCAVKARWVELVEHDSRLTEQQKWEIFCLLIGGDGRLEEVPGGLKVTLRPRSRH